MNPRDYQAEDLARIAVRFEAGARALLVSWATGLGKTVLFSLLRQRMGFAGRKMVIAHRDELITQAYDKLVAWNPGVPVGIEKAQQRCGNEPIVVSSIQTIGRAGGERLLKFDPFAFDVLVIDECQHALGDSYQMVIKHFRQNPNLLLLGVTATAKRADGRGLGDAGFEEIVAQRDILFGIRKGWLVDLRGIRIRTDTDISKVKNVAGDFNQGQLGKALNTPERNALIVREWKKHAEGRQTVMFCTDIQHSKDLAKAFRDAGVKSEAVWGIDPDRKAKLKAHRNREITVITNCDVLTEGYDDWSVSCIGLASATQSEGKYTQRVGRGTRIEDGIGNLLEALARGYTGKVDCLLLDFVDSTRKHSLVTLPTLFGLNKELDLKGKKITDVLDQIEEIHRKSPDADLSNVIDVDKLQSYAEQVDLFKVGFLPEIVQLSQYQWHKTGPNAYVLLLKNGESMAAIEQPGGKWQIHGSVKGRQVSNSHDTMQDAIRDGDYLVQMLGGKEMRTAAQRTHSRDDEAPDAAQRYACKGLKINIPLGATWGQVRLMMTKVMADKRKAA